MKLCASTTFEVLLLSTCTLCKQKSYISKDIQPIFEIFASTRRCWGWAFGWKVSSAQVFYFCNGKVKTWRIDNIWNFATFNLYTVPAEILYLQRYSTNFRDLRLSSKMLSVGICAETFSCADILVLQWQGQYFAHRQHLKFCHFQPVHCASINRTSPKAFNRFSKSFRQLEDVEGGHLFGKSQVRRYFTFAMARRKLGASTTFEILPLSTCTMCQQKSYISKDISTDFWNVCLKSKMLRVGICLESFRCAGILLLQWRGENFAHRQLFKFCHFQPVHCASRTPISPKIFNQFFEIFAPAGRCWRWPFGWKVLGAQVFYFCNGKVKTLRIDNILNFASYICLISKMLTVAIWMKSFRCADILLLHWQGENLAHRQ